MILKVEKDIDFAVIRIYVHNFIHVHVFGKVQLTLPQAQEIYKNWVAVTTNEDVWIVHSSENKFVVPSKEAVEFLRNKEPIKTVQANAYVARSFSQRLIAKAFIGLNKQTVPMSFHSSVEEAFEWLLKQKENQAR